MPWRQVYFDNFAAGAKVKTSEADELIAVQRGDAGIEASRDKSLVVSESGVELGAFVGGSGQWLGASAERW